MVNEIDRAGLTRMVHAFYARVQEDDLLGPVFHARMRGPWSEHLDKMVDFWSAALLREPGYAGNPRSVHARLDGVGPQHFRRWLELFAETLAEIFTEDVADQIHARARMMAGGLLSARGFGRHHLSMRATNES